MFADGLHQIRVAAADAAKSVKMTTQKSAGGNSDPSTLAMLFLACVCAVLPLDISQISFAMLGAILYALLQKSDRFTAKKPSAPTKKRPVTYPSQSRNSAPKDQPLRLAKPSESTNCAVQKKVPAPAAPEVRKPSVLPIVAPTFQSTGWEAEVQELLVQITPTAEVEKIVDQLAQVTRRTIENIIPQVEVVGFASGNLNFGKAFGVAVPEVDIVATVSPQVLFRCLHGKTGKSPATFEDLDPAKLQKSAIRACTDRLVAAGGFKFRRSAFRGQEPKVTLLAPASIGLSAEAIPIDFSINVVTPFYNAALLTECGKMDSRAKELILLVKRWAKDRGICHAAKGHLSPYIWGILSMYFLQHGVDEEGPVLPGFDHFEVSAGLAACSSPCETGVGLAKKLASQDARSKKSVGMLFKEFVHFFQADFDWKNEAVSIRAGQRAPPTSSLPLHIIRDGAAEPHVGLSIEDPFQATKNLGDGMNAMSFARLKEELARAETLLVKGVSLSELLEPWSPPDSEPVQDNTHKSDESHSCVQETRKGLDWRRDAAEAQGAKLPPWRR